MALLEVNTLNVAYGDVHVLYDLDISVDEGEIVSIIGGNGAGKSTLLQDYFRITEAPCPEASTLVERLFTPSLLKISLTWG